MKVTRKLTRRSFLGRVAGGAVLGGGALVLMGGSAEALQITDSDSGPIAIPPDAAMAIRAGSPIATAAPMPIRPVTDAAGGAAASPTATAAATPIPPATDADGEARGSPIATPAAMPIRPAMAADGAAPTSPTAIAEAMPIRPATGAGGGAAAARVLPTPTGEAGPIPPAAGAGATTKAKGREAGRCPPPALIASGHGRRSAAAAAPRPSA